MGFFISTYVARNFLSRASGFYVQPTISTSSEKRTLFLHALTQCNKMTQSCCSFSNLQSSCPSAGAFLIPYVTFVLLGGFPLMFLEVAMGQYTRKSAIKMWSIAPIMTVNLLAC